jgi:branched-chain amino acid transport system permease protein
VITLGISIELQNGALLTVGPNFHGIPWYWAGTVDLVGVHVATDRVAAIVIGLLAMFGLGYLISYTSIGRTLRAVSQDETGAQLLGINIASVHLFTYSLSCTLAALAGASLLFLYPAWPQSGGPPLFTAWLVVILAGLGTIGGAVAGGFVISFIQVVTDNYFGANYQAVVPSIIIIVILMVRPQGLFGSKTSKLAWD